jgi:hypothetical protein
VRESQKPLLHVAIESHAAALRRRLGAIRFGDTDGLALSARHCAAAIRNLLRVPTPEDNEALEAIINVFETIHWHVETFGPAPDHPLVGRAIVNAGDVLEEAVHVLTRWRPSDPEIAAAG